MRSLVLLLWCSLSFCFALPKEYLIGQGFYTFWHVLDWSQSHYISKSYPKHTEKNPILGRHPSASKVNAYFASTLVLHWGLGYVLYRTNRNLWRAYIGITSAVEVYTVFRNRSLGVGFGWGF